MQNNKYTVLTIAGSDSSGGAGIQADIKTISALRGYAASVITALTAQNTLGVQSIKEIPAEFVAAQLASVFNDLQIAAVKIGMLFDETIIKVVTEALNKFKPPIIVLDPVMMAKNGCALISETAITCLQDMLFPISTIITPNAIEAEKLVNKKINSQILQQQAAIDLGTKFNTNVLIKGGHIEGDQVSDVLYLREKNLCHWFHAERISTPHTHGTGCSLASAIAILLAQRFSLIEAVAKAKQYLHQSIQFGHFMQIGHGVGPVDHFYFLESEK